LVPRLTGRAGCREAWACTGDTGTGLPVSRETGPVLDTSGRESKGDRRTPTGRRRPAQGLVGACLAPVDAGSAGRPTGAPGLADASRSDSYSPFHRANVRPATTPRPATPPSPT